MPHSLFSDPRTETLRRLQALLIQRFGRIERAAAAWREPEWVLVQGVIGARTKSPVSNAATDRLLTRYINSGRKDNNELIILRAYFLSMLDRYDEARAKGEPFTIFYNHRSWGSGGRMRIFAELVRQKAITGSQQAKFKSLVTDSLKIDFPDYSQLELGVNNRPYGINGGPAIAVKMSGTASMETTRMSSPGFRPASLIAWMAPTAMSSLWA